jgi:hypothetical protein
LPISRGIVHSFDQLVARRDSTGRSAYGLATTVDDWGGPTAVPSEWWEGLRPIAVADLMAALDVAVDMSQKPERNHMPGLIRGVARTAAVVGTAGAVRHHQDQKWASKDQQAAEATAYQEQQYAPPPQGAPPPPAPMAQEDPTVAKLTQLAELHAQGILSDEEFTAAKAQALGI